MAAPRPRLWVTARLQVSAPGQVTTSRTSWRPLAHADGLEAGGARELILGQAPEGDVLAVGQPGWAHVPLDGASSRNWALVTSPRRA